ncbi:hypothetical protein INTERNEXUS_258 [Bacillus phage vB_BspM_Internexus]|nr:hypothetical protein INTERNEXUS_258 [Bacillus phage vB_BspM_Internexus]
MKNKRAKRTLNVFSVLVFAFLLLLLMGSNYVINLANTSSEKISSAIENQNRQHARSNLLYFNDKLTRDYENGKLDVTNPKQLEKWATDNLRTVKSDSTFNNFAVIEVEYSKASKEYIGNYIWRASPQNIDNGLGYMTTYDIIINQEKARVFFSNNKDIGGKYPFISYNLIKNSYKGKISDLIKEEIIRYKNPDEVQDTLNAMYEGSVSGNNDNYTWKYNNGKESFIEWTTVPLESTIGLNDEPKNKRGLINPNYKRIIIACSVDKDYVNQPFKKQITDLEHFKECVLIGVSLFVFLSIGLILYFTWLICYNNNHKK